MEWLASVSLLVSQLWFIGAFFSKEKAARNIMNIVGTVWTIIALGLIATLL